MSEHPLTADCNANITSHQFPLLIPALIQNQLRAGHVPSKLEAAQLNSVAEAVQNDLELLEEKMAQLTIVLESVGKDRDIVRRYRDHHLGLLSPIRKLPVELLLKVFSLCCTSIETPGLSITTDHHAPVLASVICTITLNLSQTCSLWRSIVLASSSLWACIQVDLTWRQFNVRALVDLYLQRSAPSMLVLHVEAFQGVMPNAINSGTSYCRELGHESLDLFEALLATAHRWVWASFDFSLDVYSELTFVSWQSVSLPKLRTLEFRSEAVHIGTPLSIARRNLRGSPSNEFFDKFSIAASLDTIRLPRLIPLFLSSFRQISTIEVTKCHTMAEIQRTLVACPNLRALKISREYGLDLYGMEYVGQIYSRSLETLTLSIRAISGLKLLPVLNLPRLVDLTVAATLSFHPDVESLRALADGLVVMLGRSPSLRALGLEGNLLSDAGLLRVLSCTPGLEEISVSILADHGGFITNKLFDALLLSPEKNLCLVPHLVSFQACIRPPLPYLSANPEFSLPEFRKVVSMLESRSGSLKQFTLRAQLDETCGYLWTDGYEEGWRLHALRSNGMALELDI